MNILFLEYPKCSTCQRAKKWLVSHDVQFEDRHIKEHNPTADELKAWIHKSGYPIKKFFNTSGIVYKDLDLKNKLPDMSEQEKIDILASDGMLVKRPLIIGEDFVLTGFQEAEWEERLNKDN